MNLRLDSENGDLETCLWSRVRVTGPDARDYLHRMTTAQVKHLRPGQITSGCFLTAQGKVRAAFSLACTEANTFTLELDAGRDEAWKKALLEVIEQFHFAEAFETVDASSSGLSWFFLSESSGEAQASRFEAFGNLEIYHHGSATWGRPWISVWGPLAERDAWAKTLGAEFRSAKFSELQAGRIQALAPWADHELVAEANPLEIGLRAAIADNKGCYPGQEVIEKIVALGSPARRLVLLQGAPAASAPAPAPGAQVVDSGSSTELGKITSVAPLTGAGAGWVALAVVRKTHARPGQAVHVAGSEVAVQAVAAYE
jgi:folate-binding protein YgfZ